MSHTLADAQSHAVFLAIEKALRGISEGTTSPAFAARHDPEQVFAIASALCEEGEFSKAVSVAFPLLARQEIRPRDAYLVGTCLQRMGLAAPASGVFGLCIALEGEAPSAGPLLRQGECVAAMGDMELALQAFDLAVEVARDSGDAEVQSFAQAKADEIRARR